MHHLIKKNKWECLLCSFAMALGCDPGKLLAQVGHTGGKANAGTGGYPRGFHVSEMIMAAINLGYRVTPLDACPVSKYPGGHTFSAVNQGEWCMLLNRQLKTTQGVITGVGLKSGQGHAVAYSHGVVYDPDGDPPYDFDWNNLDNFVPQTIWIVDLWKT